MKTFFKFFFGFIVLVLVATLLTLKIVSLNTFKQEISSFVKKNYQIDLSFNKDIEHSLFNPGLVVFNNIDISLDNKRIVTFSQLSIDLTINSLFKGDIIVKSIEFRDAILNIDNKDIDKLTKRFTASPEPTGPKKSKTKFKFLVKKFRVKNTEIKYEDYQLSKLNLASLITHEQVDIKDISFNIYKGLVNAKAVVKYSNNISLQSSGKLSGIDLSSWNQYLKSNKLSMEGLLKLDYDISWSQSSPRSPIGGIQAHSSDLIITGMNLDKLLEGFIDSREVGLLDIASYVTLGPIGAIITNTLETGKSYPGIGRGKSHIKQAFVNAEFSDGKVVMKDVAIKTSEYRLAALGKLDIIQSTYDGFAIHVLNKKGCTRIFQSLSGPLASPEVGATKTFAKGVISPLTNLFDKVKNITGCKPVYEGKVTHP